MSKMSGFPENCSERANEHGSDQTERIFCRNSEKNLIILNILRLYISKPFINDNRG